MGARIAAFLQRSPKQNGAALMLGGDSGAHLVEGDGLPPHRRGDGCAFAREPDRPERSRSSALSPRSGTEATDRASRPASRSRQTHSTSGGSRIASRTGRGRHARRNRRRPAPIGRDVPDVRSWRFTAGIHNLAVGDKVY